MPSAKLTRLVLDDVVMLGRSAPDFISGGRLTVCAAGYSPTHGFVRIYPTTLKSPLNTWNIVSVPVEKNLADNRPESWKIQGSKSEWDHLHEKIEVRGELKEPARHQLVRKLAHDCTHRLNQAHISLGIVKPASLEGYIGQRPDVDETIQKTLYNGVLPKSKSDFREQPRVKYRCDPCSAPKEHDQQLIDIGCYQWLIKHPEDPAGIFNNMGFTNPGWEKYLLVGNQNNHRSSYLVISAIWWKRRDGPVQTALSI